MLRWKCRVKPEDRLSSDVLCLRLGIIDLASALRGRRLRWFGLVQTSASWINKIQSIQADGRARRGRLLKDVAVMR